MSHPFGPGFSSTSPDLASRALEHTPSNSINAISSTIGFNIDFRPIQCPGSGAEGFIPIFLCSDKGQMEKQTNNSK